MKSMKVVLKDLRQLIPAEIEKTQKNYFKIFPVCRFFFTYFSNILWIEISSNPGLGFLYDQY